MRTATVMGRRSFRYLRALLPGRWHASCADARSGLVLAIGAEKACGAQAAVDLAGEDTDFGDRRGSIFALFLPVAHRIELTEVLEDVEGDISWPDLAPLGRSVRGFVGVHRAEDGNLPSGSSCLSAARSRAPGTSRRREGDFDFCLGDGRDQRAAPAFPAPPWRAGNPIIRREAESRPCSFRTWTSITPVVAS